MTSTSVFREAYPLVSRWTLALRVQLALLGATLPLLLTVSWWPWVLAGAAVLVVTTTWTSVRLGRAQRHLIQRVELALLGLSSRGDIKCDPEVVARLRAQSPSVLEK